MLDYLTIIGYNVEKIKNGINISEKKQNTDETILAQVEQVIEFIKYYEKNKIDTILKTQKLWHNNFKEKDDILFAINVMILFYQDILNYKLDRNIKIFTRRRCEKNTGRND